MGSICVGVSMSVVLYVVLVAGMYNCVISVIPMPDARCLRRPDAVECCVVETDAANGGLPNACLPDFRFNPTQSSSAAPAAVVEVSV